MPRPTTSAARSTHRWRRWGVERIDLLLIHRPDELMAVAETAAALDAVVAAGKVGHVGVSNHAPPRLDLLAGRLSAPLATNQIELSPIELAPLGDGTLDQAQTRGFRPMIWSPTGGGWPRWRRR